MRKAAIVIGVIATIIALGGCRGYEDYVLGNRIHDVPCEKLPIRSEAEAIVREHQETIDKIKALSTNGSVVVELEEPCPGKADLVVYHPSREIREQIEKLIGSSTFYGIPYRLINV